MTILRFTEAWPEETHPAVELFITPVGLRLGIERWPRMDHEETHWHCSPVFWPVDLYGYVKNRLQVAREPAERSEERGWKNTLWGYGTESFEIGVDMPRSSPKGGRRLTLKELGEFKLRVTPYDNGLVRFDMHGDLLKRYEIWHICKQKPDVGPPVVTWLRMTTCRWLEAALEHACRAELDYLTEIRR